MKIAVLGIDPQNSFCHPSGSLFVPGADKDMERAAEFIVRNKSKIDYIGLTQDTHHIIDISHPAFWQDKDGKNPDPFTIITAADVKNGTWSPLYQPLKVIKYLEELEAQGEFPHCIWPEHCIKGSEGYAIYTPIMDAISEWARDNHFFQIVSKGEHPLTEHFGAFRANVPIPNEPSTQLNMGFVNVLEKYDVIYFFGEAKSHCVANTLKQAFDHPALAQKLVVLQDCMSNVPGFETLADPIYAEAVKMNIEFANAADITL